MAHLDSLAGESITELASELRRVARTQLTLVKFAFAVTLVD